MEAFLESESDRIAFVLGIVAGAIALIVISNIISGKIKKKYNVSITGLSIAMLFAVLCFAIAIARFTVNDLKGLIVLVVAIIITGIVFYFNYKVFGLELGIKMLLLEIVLSIGSLFDLSAIKVRLAKLYNRIIKKQGRVTYQDRYNYYIGNSLSRYETPKNSEPQNEDTQGQL